MRNESNIPEMDLRSMNISEEKGPQILYYKYSTGMNSLSHE
jgi:hypothetical protein